MSERGELNGEKQYAPIEVDHVALAARIEIANKRADAALHLGERTKTAVEDVHAAVLDIRKLTLGLHLAVQRLANEQFEMRTGVPMAWQRRLFLVACGALLGGMSGAVASAFLK